jgi:hypothetical protein
VGQPAVANDKDQTDSSAVTEIAVSFAKPA